MIEVLYNNHKHQFNCDEDSMKIHDNPLCEDNILEETNFDCNSDSKSLFLFFYVILKENGLDYFYYYSRFEKTFEYDLKT